MVSKQRTENVNGNWVILVPIVNLEILRNAGKEYTVDEVTFISFDKLSRVRKRFRIRKPIAELRKQADLDRFFNQAKVYGVLRRKGRPSELRRTCIGLIREELLIIQALSLGDKRSSPERFGLFDELTNLPGSILFLSTEENMMFLSFYFRHSLFQLDGMWKNTRRQFCFDLLKDIITGKVKVSKEWQQDLRRALLLVGKGMAAQDLATAFLNNMIALEVLLKHPDDKKYLDVVPKRAEAILGWLGFWQGNRSRQLMERPYKLRNLLVHEGIDNIVVKDLLFTDELLLNLLMNISKHPKLFKSKDDLILFAERVQAEQTLGLKSSIRPKSLSYMTPLYSTHDVERVYDHLYFTAASKTLLTQGDN